MSSNNENDELLSSGYQGAVFKVRSDRLDMDADQIDADYVVIKQSMGNALARWFRRRMIRREHAVYERLAGTAGIPRCYGLQGNDRLVLEFIDGHPLKLANDELDNRDQFFSQLLDLLRSIHASGVAHADLKRKENILVSASEQPFLIDFGSALILPSDAGFFRSWLFGQVRQMDLNAWIKHKYLGRYDQVSGADAAIYRPTPLELFFRPLQKTWRIVTARQWRKALRRRLHS